MNPDVFGDSMTCIVCITKSPHLCTTNSIIKTFIEYICAPQRKNPFHFENFF